MTHSSSRKSVWTFFAFILVVSSCSAALAAPVVKDAPVDGKLAYSLSEEERKALIFESGPGKITMVQLFTSDANPSCNEAVKWMSSLKAKESLLWKAFVPMAMHVRLWDANGYKDAFAKNEFDAFIQSYSRRWGVNQVFAPLVVVDGVEWTGWARGQDIPLAPQKGGILHVDGTRLPNVYDVAYKPDSGIDATGGFQLHGALLGFGVQSRPADGKNRGNVLVHDFIPVLYKNMSMLSGSDGWKASLELPKTRGLVRARYAVVFWVTKKDVPLALQAVGGTLLS